MTALPIDDRAPDPRGLVWEVQYLTDLFGVPYTEHHLEVAEGYDSGELNGISVLFPMPMFPSDHEGMAHGVTRREDSLDTAHPLVMPWIGHLVPHWDPDFIYYESGTFRHWHNDVTPPTVQVWPLDLTPWDEYAIRLPLSDVRLAVPRVERDWRNTWLKTWHESEAAYQIAELMGYFDHGDPEMVLGTDRMEELYEQWNDPANEALRERFPDVLSYAFDQVAEIERGVLNADGDCLVDPVAGLIEPGATYALDRVYASLHAESAAVWERLGQILTFNPEMEWYPWA